MGVRVGGAVYGGGWRLGRWLLGTPARWLDEMERGDGGVVGNGWKGRGVVARESAIVLGLRHKQ